MFALTMTTRLRCLAVWGGVSLVLVLGLGWLLPDLQAAARAVGTHPLPPFDRWLGWLGAYALAGCLVWGWVVTTLVIAQAVRRHGAPTAGSARTGSAVIGTRLAPAWATRAVLAACGLALLAGPAPALAAGAVPVASHDPSPSPVPSDLTSPTSATSPTSPTGPSAPAPSTLPAPSAAQQPTLPLDGLPLPDRAEGSTVTDFVLDALAEAQAGGRPAPRPLRTGTTLPASPVGPRSTPPAGSGAGSSAPVRGHVVASGDSLWSIAEAELTQAGIVATDLAVARYWPRIYAHNRAVIGPDADRLEPGQRLELPIPGRVSASEGKGIR